MDALLEPLLDALDKADAAERHRLLGAWLVELAHHSQDGGKGPGGSADQLEELVKRGQRLDKENADLQDVLKTTQADLELSREQLEAERKRGEKLQPIMNEQRERAESAQKKLEEMDGQLVARNAEIHRLQTERDDLLLKTQRAELASGDDSRADALEENKAKLASQLESLQADMAALRTEKNAEIDGLIAEKTALEAKTSKGADALLLTLWERLASAKPALSQGGVQPTERAAENLFDALIELAHFVDKLDQDMGVFLTRYARHHAGVNKPWQVYAARDSFEAMIRQALVPAGAKQIGPFRMKLKAFGRFVFAATVSCDSVIESIASELQGHLMGEQFAGSDANHKIRDYLRHSGHELFMEHMVKIRSERMAQVFGSST